jgi:hypothetical protein
MNKELNTPEHDTASEPFFRCGACGCEELRVTRRFTRRTHVEATLPCDCGAEEVAVVHRYRTDTVFEQTGALDDRRQFYLDAPEELEDLDTEDEEYEVRCPACAEGVDEMCWETDPSQIEVDDCDDEFYVHCQGCGREVEFGWSHPDREGRIWPAESADFDPWKCCPEPRFAEAWDKKGWLSPGTVTPPPTGDS